MLKFITESPVNLKGCVLIVSGISVGNVPALTCDDIIKRNSFKRIAYFKTKYMEPSIGYLPAGIQNGSLGLPVQLYSKGNTLILQFRSYCRFARKKQLAKQVIQEFKKQGVDQIIMISSLPYEIRPDLQIGSVENNIYFKEKGKISHLNLLQNIEQRLLSISHLIDEEDLENDLLKYGGLAHSFFKEADKISVFFIFSEGKQDPKLVDYYSNYLTKLIGRNQIM